MIMIIIMILMCFLTSIIVIMNGFGACFYLEDKITKKDKKFVIMVIIVFVILNMIYVICLKNILLSHIILLATFYTNTYLYKKYIKQNKILEIDCESFIIFFSFFMLIKGIYDTLNYGSEIKLFSVWILEICLIFTLVVHITLLIRYSTKMTRRNVRDIRVITVIISFIYFIVAFVLNRNYVSIKIPFLLCSIIVVEVILTKKIPEVLNFVIASVLIAAYILVAQYICLRNIETKEISTESEKIIINADLNEISTLNVNDKFIFFEKDKFDKMSQLIIYTVREKDGALLLEEVDTIQDYRVYDVVDDMYLEKIIKTYQVENKNFAHVKKSEYTEDEYKLYYYK